MQALALPLVTRYGIHSTAKYVPNSGKYPMQSFGKVKHLFKAATQSTDYDIDDTLVPVFDQLALGSCFPAGTPILMADGSERAIDEIGVGNEVRTHNGKRRRVTHVFERKYSGTMYSIKLKGWCYPLTMTDEHPIAIVPNVSSNARYGSFEAGELKWVQAKDVRLGDFVLMPSNQNIEESRAPCAINVSDFVSDDCINVNGMIRIATGRRSHTIPESIKLDEDFCRLVGLFLAEGSYGKVAGEAVELNFTFARHEKAYQDFVVSAMQRIFSVDARIVENSHRSSVSDVVCSNATLARFFRNLCGDGALAKFVSPVFFKAPEQCRLALLRGWIQGDGQQDPVYLGGENRKFAPRASQVCVTASRALLRGMVQLALSCGLKPGVSIRVQSEHQNIGAGQLTFYSNDIVTLFPDVREKLVDAGIEPTGRTWYKRHDLGFLCKVQSIETEDVDDITVYNLEVDGEHTYVANMIAVHNCVLNARCAAAEIILTLEKLSYTPLSRLFPYWLCSQAQGTLGQDTGTEVSLAAERTRAIGFCAERLWAYTDDLSKFYIPPPEALVAVMEGSDNNGPTGDFAIDESDPNGKADQVEASIRANHPVQVGSPVSSAIQSYVPGTILDTPDPNAYIGGHSWLLTGVRYINSKRVFKARNSWSGAWGGVPALDTGAMQGGYFFVSDDWVRDPNFSDLVVMTRMDPLLF